MLSKNKAGAHGCFSIEAGMRELCPQSVCGRLITAVGATGRKRRMAILKLIQAAERASSWLWLRREEKSWKQSTNASGEGGLLPYFYDGVVRPGR